MKYQAICTDIDGTLLNAERLLSQRTLSAIHRLPQGLPVILASSRMPAAMTHLQKDLRIDRQPLICYNGGYVIAWDEQGEAEVLHNAPIPVDICRTAVGLGEELGFHVSLYRGEEWFVPELDYWAKREQNNTQVDPTVADLKEVLGKWTEEDYGAHKIMCMGEKAGIDEAVRQLSSQLGNDLHLYRSKDTYLEIAHKSISKATALEIVLAHLGGIALEEVVAFGDNYNDIELLEACGLGIAVENARGEVKAIANEVTLPGKLDGVAAAIEKYFL